MGDLQKSLVIMLGDNGCDLNLLHDRDGDPVDKMTLMFSATDQMILRQYECGAEPVVLLSKFFQLDVPTAHLVLVHIRARIAQMRQPKFMMYADISHSQMEVLTNRAKTVTVLSDSATDRDDGPSEPMHPCVADFRSIFADDLEVRCRLVQFSDIERIDVEDVPRLDVDIAIACLLHPLVGGTSC
jgi:hypothetical protein